MPFYPSEPPLMPSAEAQAAHLSAADVTFIVPVGGAAPGWERSARSLARLDPPPAEIIIVVDGPDPRLEDISAFTEGRVLVLEERGGPARARNRGAALAESEILFFVDADIEVPASLARQIAELFPPSGEPGAVIGSYDDDPGDPGFLSQYRNLLHHFVHQNGREEASTFWSGCGAVRRRIFEEQGGFDEAYPVPSIEDIELGARIRRAGHAIRLVKALQVKHLKKWRLLQMLETDLLRRAVPWTQLMLREGGLVNDLNVKTRDRLSVLLSGLLLLVLAGALFWPWAFALVPLLLAAIAGLNLDLLRFLRRRRGFLFSAAAFPAFLAYLWTCGFGFVLGTARHRLGGGGVRAD